MVDWKISADELRTRTAVLKCVFSRSDECTEYHVANSSYMGENCRTFTLSALYDLTTKTLLSLSSPPLPSSVDMNHKLEVLVEIYPCRSSVLVLTFTSKVGR